MGMDGREISHLHTIHSGDDGVKQGLESETDLIVVIVRYWIKGRETMVESAIVPTTTTFPSFFCSPPLRRLPLFLLPLYGEHNRLPAGSITSPGRRHGCQMAKFDPFLSLDCARVEGVGAQSKERKGSNFAA